MKLLYLISIGFMLTAIFFAIRALGSAFGFFDYDWEMDMIKCFVFFLMAEYTNMRSVGYDIWG